MNAPQVRLQLSLFASAFAIGAWAWSFTVLPGRGMLRTALLAGVLFLLLYPYEDEFLAVTRERPLDQAFWGGVIAAWLFGVLAVVLVAQSRGYSIAKHRDTRTPVAAFAMLTPFLLPVAWRFLQIFARRGRNAPQGIRHRRA